MYIGEGYKRQRHEVCICNSDPNVIRLSHHWMKRFARNRITFWVQYHADQDLDELRRFWGEVLAVAPDEIRMQRKSNSNQLAGRTWRSQYGVLTLRVGDTHFRARLEAWMDRVRSEWLDLAARGA